MLKISTAEVDGEFAGAKYLQQATASTCDAVDAIAPRRPSHRRDRDSPNAGPAFL